MRSGHFIWVNLGAKLGFSDAMTEKKVFQRLLDGGVYVVSPYPSHLCLVDVDIGQKGAEPYSRRQGRHIIMPKRAGTGLHSRYPGTTCW
jgi:hypothetical protein